MDVAARAGVSKSTVSRVLTGNPKVHPATRARIEQAIRDLDYRPNALARGLVHGRTRTLGLVVNDLANPFFALLARGARLAADARGFSMLIVESDGTERHERACLAMLAERRVDGILLASMCPIEVTMDEVRCSGLQVVLVDSVDEDGIVSSVGTDNRRGGVLATQHLLQLGHRRIAFLGDVKTSATAHARLIGYRLAHRDASLEPPEELIIDDLRHLAMVQTAISQAIGLPRPPTAIFSVNDHFAVAALQALDSLGLRVPEDVTLVGYDDIPLAAWLSIPLTTVSQPKEEQGRIAADVLIDQIEQRTQAVRIIRLQPRLVVRRSSGAPRPVPLPPLLVAVP